MLQRRSRYFALAAALLFSGAAAEAQQPRGFCWFRTDSKCSVILLTEAGYARVLTRSEREYTGRFFPNGQTYTEAYGPEHVVQWQLGLLKRIDPKISAGASFNLRLGTPSVFWYARGRYWLKPERSIDAGLGLHHSSYGSSGVSAFAGYSFDDKINVRVTYDDLDWPNYLSPPDYSYVRYAERARSVNVGASLGAAPGAIAQGASAIGFATLLILYLTYYED